MQSATACDASDFPYENAPQNGLEKAWNIAIGLQQVDALFPSRYLQAIASETIDGTLSLNAAGAALRTYYRERDAANKPVD